jgi:small subunit ribosomal protein S9
MVVTHYTCLLDVNLKVWGGGYNGQVEAIIPALANAVQGFDMNTRKTLKYFGLMKRDGRQVERKKIGKQKARKGNVYRRR